MSRHDRPTVLSVIDRALGDQERTARLQSLIITATFCTVAVIAILAAIIALSGGHVVLSVSLGAIPAIFGAPKAWKYFKKKHSHPGKS